MVRPLALGAVSVLTKFFMCANDMMTCVLMKACAFSTRNVRHGQALPRDVSVHGSSWLPDLAHSNCLLCCFREASLYIFPAF